MYNTTKVMIKREKETVLLTTDLKKWVGACKRKGIIEMKFYRYWCEDKDLISCNVVIKESDLYIRAQKNLEKKTFKAVSKYRLILEKYIAGNPFFKNSLEPVSLKGKVPLIVEKMAEAAKKTGVGPMAAVAGE